MSAIKNLVNSYAMVMALYKVAIAPDLFGLNSDQLDKFEKF